MYWFERHPCYASAVEDLAREYGCPSTPSTPGNRSTVALDVKEAQELKQPREENARLKTAPS
jgi:hypothetical protein